MIPYSKKCFENSINVYQEFIMGKNHINNRTKNCTLRMSSAILQYIYTLKGTFWSIFSQWLSLSMGIGDDFFHPPFYFYDWKYVFTKRKNAYLKNPQNKMICLNTLKSSTTAEGEKTTGHSLNDLNYFLLETQFWTLSFLIQQVINA